MFQKGVLLIIVAAGLAAVVHDALAVSLRPGKATDSSVCDLGPNTTTLIGQRVLVPAVADSKDKIAAYFRLAGAFVTENCSNGQLLILHGSTDLPSDGPALDQVANSSCLAADVRRTEGRASNGPASFNTFELRCTIRKLDEFKATLQSLETQDPMSALKTRLAGASGSATVGASSAAPSDKRDCSKVTLSTVLVGGSCK